MKVHLYTVCWNEADMLPFFFRHYDPFVDRYVVFDDGSTDGSLDILHTHPKVELRQFERTVPDSFVLSHRNLQNEVWKESRGNANWVIVTAIDEHLEVKGGMNGYLSACSRAGVTLVPALGFQMLSNDMPGINERLASTRTLGAPFDDMCKLSIFNPDAVRKTSFKKGRHSAKPVGILRLPPRDELMLLHYKYLGFERTHERQCALRRGLGATDRARHFGFQYWWSAEQLRDDWDGLLARAVDVGHPAFKLWQIKNLKRWWRPAGFLDADPEERASTKWWAKLRRHITVG